jgi:hypothetical protein
MTTVVYRYRLAPKIWMDTDALPCPRCRSQHLRRESHPAIGSMVTCLDCGGRDYLENWNDGEITLDRIEGKDSFAHNGGLKFERPESDKIVKTTRNKALRLSKGGRA